MIQRLYRLVDLKFDHIFVIILYSITVILKFPALSKNICTHIAGKGDSLLNLFILESMYHNVTSNLSGFFTVPMYFPEKLSYAFNVNLLGLQFINFPIRMITGNPVLSHNIVFLSGFVLSAWCTYILVKRFIPHPEIAFIGGLFVGFSPVFLIRTNIAYCSIYAIPLGLLYFDNLLRNRSWKNFLLSGLLFLVLSLVTFHQMFFLFLGYISYFFLFSHYHKLKKLDFINTFKTKISVTILLIIIFLFPLSYPYYAISEKYELKRSIGQTVQYSSDAVFSYLSNPNHVITGDVDFTGLHHTFSLEESLFGLLSKVGGEKIQNAVGLNKVGNDMELSLDFFNDIWNSGRHEANNLIGFIPLIFLISFIIILIRMPRNTKYNEVNLFNINQAKVFLGMLISFYILSLGPVLVIGGHLTYIPLPFLPLYYIIPGFQSMRVTARFGYMFVLFASVLSCYSIYHFKKIVINRFRPIIYYCGVVLVGSLFIFEINTGYLNESSLYKPYSKETIPDVYKWLMKQEITGGILEIPTVKGTLSKYDPPEFAEKRAFYNVREIEYIYRAVIHKKPIANGSGAFFSPVFMKIRDMMYNFPDEPARKYLKEMQINTVIVHKTELDEQEKEFWADLLLQNQYIKILYEDSDDIVVELI